MFFFLQKLGFFSIVFFFPANWFFFQKKKTKKKPIQKQKKRYGSDPLFAPKLSRILRFLHFLSRFLSDNSLDFELTRFMVFLKRILELSVPFILLRNSPQSPPEEKKLGKSACENPWKLGGGGGDTGKHYFFEN